MFDQPSLDSRFYSFVTQFLAWRWARFVGSAAIVFGVGLGILGVGLGLRAGSTVALASSQPRVECAPDSATEQTDITVDVSGGVVNPGVYQIPQGSRGVDAVAVAGGFSSEADSIEVAARINLALTIADESKVYIPVVADATSNSVQPATTGTQLISINSATAKELETLAGIGAKRAGDIIANRPYTTIDELITKGGLTQKLLDDIFDFIEL